MPSVSIDGFDLGYVLGIVGEFHFNSSRDVWANLYHGKVLSDSRIILPKTQEEISYDTKSFGPYSCAWFYASEACRPWFGLRRVKQIPIQFCCLEGAFWKKIYRSRQDVNQKSARSRKDRGDIRIRGVKSQKSVSSRATVIRYSSPIGKERIRKPNYFFITTQRPPSVVISHLPSRWLDRT
jgi:hypothetical protein